jgi:hypothetical protein
MAKSDSYDYLEMCHFIEEFKNPFPVKPFITEMEEIYRLLWQFEDCIDGNLLEYLDTKIMHTYSIKSQTLLRFYPSMSWRKSFLMSSSMASILSSEFKL